MPHKPMDRRTFVKSAATAMGTICLADPLQAAADPVPQAQALPADYRGPRVIVIRFGGGVRRRETIEAGSTYAPFFHHELIPRGTLYPNMTISQTTQVNGHDAPVATSHGEGTLNILTGRYDVYKDVGDKFLGARFEARVPTLFEYLRKTYNVPPHQCLIVNGEDRTDEEFYSFSNHHLFGVNYRCNLLSLYRFKCHLLRKQVESARLPEKEQSQKQQKLRELEALDYRNTAAGQGPQISQFWEEWRQYYGDSGYVNPRGDRLLTELTIRAMKQLRPKLVMVNFQDPDYVHWGNIHHYTQGIAIIDEGIRRIYEAAQQIEGYRDNTVFAIVPDCGRDNNRMIAVPCQHHFNSRGAREVFALLLGPGIAKGRVVTKPVEQIAVAPTLGRIMGLRTELAEADILQEALA